MWLVATGIASDFSHWCDLTDTVALKDKACADPTKTRHYGTIVHEDVVKRCRDSCGNSYEATVQFVIQCDSGYVSSAGSASLTSKSTDECAAEAEAEADRKKLAAKAVQASLDRESTLMTQDEIRAKFPNDPPVVNDIPLQSIALLPRAGFYLVEVRAADPASLPSKSYKFRAPQVIEVALPFKIGRDVAASPDFSGEKVLRGLQFVRRDVRPIGAAQALTLTAEERHELTRMLIELGKRKSFSIPRAGVCGQLVFKGQDGEFGEPLAMPITLVDVVKLPDGRLRRRTQSLVWKCTDSAESFEATGPLTEEPLPERISADAVDGSAPGKVSPVQQKPDMPAAPTLVTPVKMGTNPGR